MLDLIIKYLSRNYEITDELHTKFQLFDKNENKMIGLKIVIQNLLATFSLKIDDINGIIDKWIEYDKRTKKENNKKHKIS